MGAPAHGRALYVAARELGTSTKQEKSPLWSCTANYRLFVSILNPQSSSSGSWISCGPQEICCVISCVPSGTWQVEINPGQGMACSIQFCPFVPRAPLPNNSARVSCRGCVFLQCHLPSTPLFSILESQKARISPCFTKIIWKTVNIHIPVCLFMTDLGGLRDPHGAMAASLRWARPSDCSARAFLLRSEHVLMQTSAYAGSAHATFGPHFPERTQPSRRHILKWLLSKNLAVTPPSACLSPLEWLTVLRLSLL